MAMGYMICLKTSKASPCLGVWHIRSYFEKAKENDPERANHFLTQVQSLYLLEQQMKDNELDWDRKAVLRQSMTMPVPKNLQEWLTGERQKVLPKSAIEKAIAYSLEQWKRIIRYTQSGGLMIDNNLIKNQQVIIHWLKV